MDVIEKYLREHSDGKDYPVCSSELAKAFGVPRTTIRRMINTARSILVKKAITLQMTKRKLKVPLILCVAELARWNVQLLALKNIYILFERSILYENF